MTTNPWSAVRTSGPWLGRASFPTLILLIGCGSHGTGAQPSGSGGSGAGPSASTGAGAGTTSSAGSTGAGTTTSSSGAGSSSSGASSSGGYALNPPDPCSNQFYVSGCQQGVASSTCGGHCAVANACSPPEDPSKSQLPMTFICPRFMLFSKEMEVAIKDDTTAQGWGDPANPPFEYGVVGHDPDLGGLDSGSSTCCQCYQLVFDTPQYGPKDAPTPKPMIVQSFNTAAGGAKNFDVFIGVGGYGAFNACFDDPSFGNTSKFGHFLYSAYPTQNPETGGVGFLNDDACKSNGTPTLASVSSAACQDAIKSACDQAVGNSALITDQTQTSCIRGNQPGSLYHQNWNVRAKKVECPEALTRVTGCRLQSAGLPMPDPAAQTVATADASFKSGYTTTTMEDCCKPTCAWQDYVTGSQGNLMAQGPWNSFYSCDQDGAPMTAP